MKKRKRSVVGLAILAIQAILSIALFVLSIKVGLFPDKYLALLAGVLLLLLALTAGLILKKRKPNKKSFAQPIGQIISLLVSIALLIGSFALYSGGDVLSKITGFNFETHVTSAIVMKDDPAQSLSDVKGETFMYTTAGDQEYIDKAITSINDQLNMTVATQSVASYSDLVNGLYDGTYRVILLNDAHTAFAEMVKENFSNETRVIYSDEQKEVIASDDVSGEINVAKQPFTIYISGIDTYGPVTTVSRSDVNLLVTVNPTTHQVLMTSIPRDYYVTLASFGAKDKLTHSGIYGIQESVATIENLLDINIDFYARVNFTSVVDIVNALGGVTVNSPYSFQAWTNSSVYIQAGENNLNGEEALAFVRERYSLPNGDRDRVKNQQRLLTAIINKATSPAILANFNGVLSSVAGSFQLSMSDTQLSKLIKAQVDNPSSWDIQHYSLDGTGSMSTTTYSMPGSNLYVMIPDENMVLQGKQYIDSVVNGETVTTSE